MNVNDLRDSQKQPVSDIMSTLQSIEINPSEMCNRSCVFCPRTDPSLYKNKKEFIKLSTCETIAQQLIEINYTGRIGLVGFGEPTLHPQIIDCIRILRKTSANWIEINTNGDFLTRQLVESLSAAGCTHIGISLYDSDLTKEFDRMVEGINITIVYRHHYNASDNYNLNLVNRIEITQGNTLLDINRPCYLPFYKMFIDWNGDYLLCDQDWARYTGGQYNVDSTSIKDYWTDKVNQYRLPLISGDRSVYSPCNRCDVNGVLRGKECFDLIAQTI